MHVDTNKLLARLDKVLSDQKTAESMSLAGQSILGRLQQEQYFAGLRHGIHIAKVAAVELERK
jgi:hypothetical protein